MQGRDSWQALQKHLAAARAAAGIGDRETALAAVNAALEIDPEFLAAQTLRDRLLKDEPAAPPPASSSPVVRLPQPAARETAVAAAPPRDVSPESYARFQQRARDRRLTTRVDAAREAIRRRHLKEAAAALDEVRDLEPGHPELAPLAAQFAALRQRTATAHRGPWAVAAAVFIATTLGASYVQDSSWLLSRPLTTAGVLLPAEPDTRAPSDARAVATSGDIAGIALVQPSPDLEAPPASASLKPIPLPVNRVANPIDVNLLAPTPSVSQPPAPQLVTLQPPVPAPVTIAPVPVTIAQVPALPAPASPPAGYVPASAASSVPPPPRPAPGPDDSALVQNALHRYRRAYEDLDAESAHAVWPAVNEAALARAFDGLESQTLTFDACNVRVLGEAATATCRGSARYVPKIGSREPRVESRVWNFTLKKSGAGWTIDTARAER